MAVLLLRAVIDNGDFDDAWAYHAQREYRGSLANILWSGAPLLPRYVGHDARASCKRTQRSFGSTLIR